MDILLACGAGDSGSNPASGIYSSENIEITKRDTKKRMKGTYTLLIELPENKTIKIGKLGEIEFQKGFFAYVGSGLNGLEQRIARHLRKDKRFHWHIDFLLEKARVRSIVYAESPIRMECTIANQLIENLQHIDKFGCSDCKCRSHLFYCKKLDELEKRVLDSFQQNGLKAIIRQ